MKKCLLQATALLLALALGQSAQADNLAYSHAAGGCCDACGADHCDGGCCDYGCDSGCYGGGCSWNGGAEIIFIQPDVGPMEAIYFEDNDGNSFVRSFEWDYEPAWRVWAGVTDCEGWGYRVRYFSYDEDSDVESAVDDGVNITFAGRDLGESSGEYFREVDAQNPFDLIVVQADLDIEMLDFEAMQAFDSCYGTITLAGGVRFGRIDTAVLAASFVNGNLNNLDEAHLQTAEFDGAGPTFAIDLRRPMSGNLSFVTGMRTSILYGESEVEVDTENDEFFIQERDGSVFIAEVMVGVEWSRCTASGRVLFARAAWEMQHYSGMPVATAMGENFSDPSEIGMEGFAFGGGVGY